MDKSYKAMCAKWDELIESGMEQNKVYDYIKANGYEQVSPEIKAQLAAERAESVVRETERLLDEAEHSGKIKHFQADGTFKWVDDV